MDKVVTISSNQSLMDLSLQYYGSVERVFDIITQLGVESLDSNPTGLNLTITTANTTNNVYQFCFKNNITIANKLSPELAQDLVPIVRYRVTTDSDSRIVQGGDFRIV